MKSRPWMIISVSILVGLASCAQLQTLSSVTTPNSKKQAQERWNQVRSRLKYQLAADSLASGHLDKAEVHLNETIALNPTSPDNYVLLTKLLIERGEIASAAEALDKATSNGGNSAEIDYLYGSIAQRYGRFADALRWYQQASAREPARAHYVEAVAETLVSLDRPLEALTLVRQRWTDFEQNATLRALAGDIHMMLAQYEEAANAYQEAARIAADDVLLKSKLGEALTLGGNYGEAREILIAARATVKDMPPSALISLGRCHLELDQKEDAQAVLQAAVDAAPTNARCWSWLTRAALAANDLLTARRAAIRTVELDPAHSDHQVMLAYVCWRQGDSQGGTAAVECALRSSPDDPMAKYLLKKIRETAKQAGSLSGRQPAPASVEPIPRPGNQLSSSGLSSVGSVQPGRAAAAGRTRSP